MEPHNDGTEISAFALKTRLSPFWRQKPRLWFAQFESIIAGQKVGDEAKYHIAVAQLEQADIEQVSDIVLKPPTTNKYEALKERLLAVYEESEARQLQKLMSETELGNQKPSQLLRRMRDLSLDKFPDSTLRLMWTSHLPAPVRTYLAVCTETKLDILAAMADKMTEESKEAHSICSCQGQAQQHPSRDDRIIAEIESLKNEIASLKIERGRQQRRWTRNRTQSPSRTRHQTCYYHRKFGHEAYRCQPPCNFKNKKTEQSEN